MVTSNSTALTVDATSFNNVMICWPKLTRTDAYTDPVTGRTQEQVYSIEVFFDDNTAKALKLAGFKVKKDKKINPVTQKLESCMELKGAPADKDNGRPLPHQPKVVMQGEEILRSRVGAGSMANLMVYTRPDSRFPDKLVTTLGKINIKKLVEPTPQSVGNQQIQDADDFDFEK